ncbi:MAG TPA: RNA polymerase sigma-70 factor [Cyclobacteriaceae bacterium]
MSDGSQIHPFKIDLEAFTSLFRDHYPNLRGYARLFVDEEVAEDIVQEVFVYVWENKENITIHTSVKAYLFKATYTRCLNYINRQKMLSINHQQIENELRDYQSSFFDPDKNEIIRKLYMNDLRDEIDRAIESLPQKCREVFTLSYIKEMQNKEISKLLEISVSTVEKHINHALKVLRQLLHNKLMLFFLAFFI